MTVIEGITLAGTRGVKAWTPNLARYGRPHYLAIADAIADDIVQGASAWRIGFRRNASWRISSGSISPPWRAAMSRRSGEG